MIIVKKTGYIEYKNFEFKCALGKNGIKKKSKKAIILPQKGHLK